MDQQAKLSERALELLALPDDGIPRLLLDIGITYFFSPDFKFRFVNFGVTALHLFSGIAVVFLRLWIWVKWGDTL